MTVKSESDARTLRIWLQDVTCRDTEDMTGGDEFYIVGGSCSGLVESDFKDSSRSIVTPVIEINDHGPHGETKPFPAMDPTQSTASGLVFARSVKPDDLVVVSFQAYDADFSLSEWDSKYKDIATALVGAVTGAVAAAFTSGSGAALGATIGSGILKAIAPSLGSILQALDPPDLLGSYSVHEKASEWFKRNGKVIEWSFSDRVKKADKGWSDWDYTVRYEIEVD